MGKVGLEGGRGDATVSVAVIGGRFHRVAGRRSKVGLTDDSGR